MNTSRHAAIRMQQRGIPPLIVDWLHLYGDEQHDHKGSTIRFFSKHSWKALKHEVGKEPLRRMSDFRGAYIIESDGIIVTVGRRFKRIIRH